MSKGCFVDCILISYSISFSGLFLDGISNYVQCYPTIATYVSRISGYTLNPFTISLLFKPNSYEFDEKTTFIVIGSSDGRANVDLQKRSRYVDIFCLLFNQCSMLGCHV